MQEVTVIVENRIEDRLLQLVGERPVYQHTNLTSVEVIFGNTYYAQHVVAESGIAEHKFD